MELEYKLCHMTHLHYATLCKRNKVIAVARNSIGSRSKGSGYSDRTIHAERAVVKRLGDISQLEGCTMTVIRINKQNQIVNSEPCRDCMIFLDKCINKYKLRKVIYS